MSFHAFNCILFNHESPIRGETFVTRKIIRAVTVIYQGHRQKLYLGNLNAKRDWGYARDYMDGTWPIVQNSTPGDWVLTTGDAAKARKEPGRIPQVTFKGLVGEMMEADWRKASMSCAGADWKFRHAL